MPNPYDVALRERAVKAYERGEGTYAEVAVLFMINPRTLERWVARARAGGSLSPYPKGGGWRSPIDLPTLRTVVAEAPDATLAELCWEYNRRASVPQRTTLTSVHRALRRDGYVLKKNGRGRAKSTGRTSAKSERRF